MRAEGLGHLHGVAAHAARGTGDQNLQPGLYLAVVSHRLQGGEPGDSDPSSLDEGEAGRLGDQLVLEGTCALGVGALADPEHLIAGLEAGHVPAHRLHDAGQVHARHGVLGCSQPIAGQADRVGQAGHEVPDTAVHACGVDPDQDLVVGDLGLGNLGELEHVG